MDSIKLSDNSKYATPKGRNLRSVTNGERSDQVLVIVPAKSTESTENAESVKSTENAESVKVRNKLSVTNKGSIADGCCAGDAYNKS
jgi:hypothetical protein